MFILTGDKKKLIDVDRLELIKVELRGSSASVVGYGYDDDTGEEIGFYADKAEATATIEEIADALARDQRVVKLTVEAI